MAPSLHFFSATNGVKQGGVPYPRLFNVYLNELLSKLRENRLGCHTNGQFVGTFIYADDITILAPSHSSLQSMLTICDQYIPYGKVTCFPHANNAWNTCDLHVCLNKNCTLFPHV